MAFLDGEGEIGGGYVEYCLGREILLREEVSWMEKGIVVLIKRFDEETGGHRDLLDSEIP